MAPTNYSKQVLAQSSALFNLKSYCNLLAMYNTSMLHVIPVVMHNTTTTTRIAPTIAPTGGDSVGMKKLKVMLYNWSCGRVGLIP